MTEQMNGLHRFLRYSLKLAKASGDDDQKASMQLFIALAARCGNELADLKSGVRQHRNHPHHPIFALEKSLENGKRRIGLLDAEILGHR